MGRRQGLSLRKTANVLELFHAGGYGRRMVDLRPDQPRKGRGSISNPSSRFDAERRFAIDDGWSHASIDPD
ncbi:MAG: hypothetical protein JNL66_06845, partial [Alphaproteobacteria bacterium]|nr:hypothetical protein [Alphaproteobacteria bacterium]